MLLVFLVIRGGWACEHDILKKCLSNVRKKISGLDLALSSIVLFVLTRILGLSSVVAIFIEV